MIIGNASGERINYQRGIGDQQEEAESPSKAGDHKSTADPACPWGSRLLLPRPRGLRNVPEDTLLNRPG